jgi:sec-independent protein translocase protein TatA
MTITIPLVFLWSLGGGEIFLILLIVLLFFGAKRIPGLARGLGKGIKDFKDAKNGVDEKQNAEKK